MPHAASGIFNTAAWPQTHVVAAGDRGTVLGIPNVFAQYPDTRINLEGVLPEHRERLTEHLQQRYPGVSIAQHADHLHVSGVDHYKITNLLRDGVPTAAEMEQTLTGHLPWTKIGANAAEKEFPLLTALDKLRDHVIDNTTHMERWNIQRVHSNVGSGHWRLHLPVDALSAEEVAALREALPNLGAKVANGSLHMDFHGLPTDCVKYYVLAPLEAAAEKDRANAAKIAEAGRDLTPIERVQVKLGDRLKQASWRGSGVHEGWLASDAHQNSVTGEVASETSLDVRELTQAEREEFVRVLNGSSKTEIARLGTDLNTGRPVVRVVRSDFSEPLSAFCQRITQQLETHVAGERLALEKAKAAEPLPVKLAAEATTARAVSANAHAKPAAASITVNRLNRRTMTMGLKPRTVPIRREDEHAKLLADELLNDESHANGHVPAPHTNGSNGLKANGAHAEHAPSAIPTAVVEPAYTPADLSPPHLPEPGLSAKAKKKVEVLAQDTPAGTFRALPGEPVPAPVGSPVQRAKKASAFLTGTRRRRTPIVGRVDPAAASAQKLVDEILPEKPAPASVAVHAEPPVAAPEPAAPPAISVTAEPPAVVAEPTEPPRAAEVVTEPGKTGQVSAPPAAEIPAAEARGEVKGEVTPEPTPKSKAPARAPKAAPANPRAVKYRAAATRKTLTAGVNPPLTKPIRREEVRAEALADEILTPKKPDTYELATSELPPAPEAPATPLPKGYELAKEGELPVAPPEPAASAPVERYRLEGEAMPAAEAGSGGYGGSWVERVSDAAGTKLKQTEGTALEKAEQALESKGGWAGKAAAAAAIVGTGVIGMASLGMVGKFNKKPAPLAPNGTEEIRSPIR